MGPRSFGTSVSSQRVGVRAASRASSFRVGQPRTRPRRVAKGRTRRSATHCQIRTPRGPGTKKSAGSRSRSLRSGRESYQRPTLATVFRANIQYAPSPSGRRTIRIGSGFSSETVKTKPTSSRSGGRPSSSFPAGEAETCARSRRLKSRTAFSFCARRAASFSETPAGSSRNRTASAYRCARQRSEKSWSEARGDISAASTVGVGLGAGRTGTRAGIGNPCGSAFPGVAARESARIVAARARRECERESLMAPQLSIQRGPGSTTGGRTAGL